MSYTTDLLLCVDWPGDKGIEPFVQALRGLERFSDTLAPINLEAAGGSRNYTGAVYALGTNHFPTQELQELIDSVRWSNPGNVVLVVCSEDWTETRTIRPTYEIEHSGYYGAETRAVQTPAKSGGAE